MRALVATVALAALAGCAPLAASPDLHRTTEGPTADQVFAARFAAGYNRPPTFDETTAFRSEMDQRIADYFARRPEVAASPRASQIRFARRVAVGMPREEVVLLAGEPLAVTRDPNAMREAAGAFWPAVQARAQELWVYPGDWRLFFDAAQLVDVTYVGRPPQ